MFGIFTSESCTKFWVNAAKLIEKILSGIDINHSGAKLPTPRQAIAKSKEHTAKNILLFFLNTLLWTIKKVMIPNTHKTTTILIIIHEKFPRDGLTN